MVERMTGGQAVVRSLAEHGVDVAFGIPGVRANSPAELEAAIAEASARNVPTIIDTPITWTG
jgi:thiamine pyrophosphate-dependent acetolactate synthase large subunit-like protein